MHDWRFIFAVLSPTQRWRFVSLWQCYVPYRRLAALRRGRETMTPGTCLFVGVGVRGARQCILALPWYADAVVARLRILLFPFWFWMLWTTGVVLCRTPTDVCERLLPWDGRTERTRTDTRLTLFPWRLLPAARATPLHAHILTL